MHYFAHLNQNYACIGILEIDDATYDENVAGGYQYENEFCIRIDSKREDLELKKKYIDGEWVSAKPSEFNMQTDEKFVHMPDDMWLNEVIGCLANLHTDTGTAKTSLVDAINSCFARQNDLESRIAALESAKG